jgi:uncharacterized protein YbjT (DUF2867 family)
MANIYNKQTVAVTGATGFVGRYVVTELLRRGVSVRALGRSRDKAREVLSRDAALTFVEGDALNPKALPELLRGATACIHLIGIIRESGGGQTFQRVHVDTTRAVADACAAAGVGRLLHMSALGAGPEGRAKYQKTKWEAEQIVRRSGLAWTIFRPSLIHGAEGEFIQMVKGMCSGQEPPYYFLPYFSRSGPADDRVPLGGSAWESAKVQPVAVEDVAAAFAEALVRPETVGEIYNLVGPDVMDWPELLTTLRDTVPSCHTKLAPWHIPGAHGAIIAKAAKALGLGGLLPFDEGQAIMATQDSVSETAKAAAHLGLNPRPFRAAVAGYAGRV